MVKKMRTLATCLALGLAAALAGAAWAAPQSGNFQVMDGPLGGKIFYGRLEGQPTLQAATSQMLQRIGQQFRARPQVNKVLKVHSGELVAVFFHVEPAQARKKTAGLLLVYVTQGQPARAALMVDDASHFRVSWIGMLKRLQQAASGSSASTALGELIAPTAGAPTAGSAAPGSSTRTGADSLASFGQDPAPSAASGSAQDDAPAPALGTDCPPVPKGVAEALQATTFSDGSGRIGLPQGWSLDQSQRGVVVARGPGGAFVERGAIFQARQPPNPQSRAMAAADAIVASERAAPVTILQRVDAFVARKEGRAPHEFHPICLIHRTAGNAGWHASLMMGTADFRDGSEPMFMIASLETSDPTPDGRWSISLDQMYVPRTTYEQRGATFVAMYNSYKPDAAVIARQTQQAVAGIQATVDRAHANVAAQQAYVDSVRSSMHKREDVMARGAAAADNDILGVSVVRDREYNEHATVDYDFADALVNANPNRFQVVPQDEFVKGVDY